MSSKKTLLFKQIRWKPPLLLLLFIVNCALVFPQSKKEKLQQNKNKIEKEIQYTNKLLEETKENKKASLNQLVILKKKIGKRGELIKVINNQLDQLSFEIDNNKRQIQKLNEDLQSLKKQYARIIYYAFKNRNAYSRLMFIFAAEDFNQAYLRLKYLQQYRRHRKQQAELIVKTQNLLNERVQKLQEQKLSKIDLLQEEENEKKKLASEKDEQNNTVQTLKKKESGLMAKLRKKQAAARKLQKAIEKIIAEEIRKAKAESAGTMSLTPEEIKLSNSFALNRGKLPWPLAYGVVSSTFGEHPHPLLPGIKTQNNGIDITTNKGTVARAVFNGTITGIIAMPNGTKAIIVRHGDYLTVYSNLDNVTVKTGDKIQTKQSIGNIFSNPEDSKTELHFELWHNKDLQNPSLWLAK